MPAAYMVSRVCPEQYKRKQPQNCGYVSWLWHDIWASAMDALISLLELESQLADKLAVETGDTTRKLKNRRLANFNRRVRDVGLADEWRLDFENTFLRLSPSEQHPSADGPAVASEEPIEPVANDQASTVATDRCSEIQQRGGPN
ncbi:MAG TPA: hypothetical protein VMJ32_17045 [Pirellulales bacterium]|nr:hypothetical protein [Pirellulales bacterium]